MNHVDPESFIASAEPGRAIYARWKEKAEDSYETAFFVQEENRYINRVSRHPQIRIKAALALYGGVPLVVVLILVNNDFDMLYEVYFNYHQTGGGRKYFEDLAGQDRILLFFYRNSQRKRNIRIGNSLRDAFRAFMTEIARHPQWGMSDFDRARELFYKDYETPEILWRKLRADFSMFN